MQKLSTPCFKSADVEMKEVLPVRKSNRIVKKSEGRKMVARVVIVKRTGKHKYIELKPSKHDKRGKLWKFQLIQEKDLPFALAIKT